MDECHVGKTAVACDLGSGGQISPRVSVFKASVYAMESSPHRVECPKLGAYGRHNLARNGQPETPFPQVRSLK